AIPVHGRLGASIRFGRDAARRGNGPYRPTKPDAHHLRWCVRLCQWPLSAADGRAREPHRSWCGPARLIVNTAVQRLPTGVAVAPRSPHRPGEASLRVEPAPPTTRAEMIDSAGVPF